MSLRGYIAELRVDLAEWVPSPVGKLELAPRDAAMLDEIERRCAMSAPRSMDSAPKDEHGVIAYSPTFYQGRGGWVAAVWMKDGWHSNPGGWRFEPTHWIPMPASPAAAAGGTEEKK